MTASASPQPPWTADALLAVEDCSDALLLLHADRSLQHANPAARSLARLLAPGTAVESLPALVPEAAWQQAGREGLWQGRIDAGGMPLACTLRGEGSGARHVLTLQPEAATDGEDLRQRHQALDQAFRQLASAQEQLLHTEKMASIGQLAAGVAHEINNPIGYVASNIGALEDYVEAVASLLQGYELAIAEEMPAPRREELAALRERLDIDYILRDSPQLLAESGEGIERVIRIVQDLKELSHAHRGGAMVPADLLAGLESTLNIVWNELKYKVRLEKHFAELPPVECNLPEINQVFMNLLINAGQAIAQDGVLTLGAGVEGEEVWISVSDTGAGIPEELLPQILEPFFTTKPVGKGTGLGLAIANRIIAKHHGRLQISSTPGAGSTFRIVLPVRQPAPPAA